MTKLNDLQQIADGTMKTRIKESIKKIIAGIKPFDEVEEQHKADALQWINSGADIFRVQKPDVPPKHLVSYFVVYDEAAQLFLLVDHKLSGLWLPSGGHVEVDEDPADTVRRECQEELGIEADLASDQPRMVTVTKTVGQGEHTDVSLWYLLNGTKDMNLDWDHREFNGVKWWSGDEIKTKGVNNFDPHMLRFASKVKELVAA